eukprot:7130187-Pyramimonas_sp.AAC.1
MSRSRSSTNRASSSRAASWFGLPIRRWTNSDHGRRIRGGDVGVEAGALPGSTCFHEPSDASSPLPRVRGRWELE